MATKYVHLLAQLELESRPLCADINPNFKRPSSAPPNCTPSRELVTCRWCIAILSRPVKHLPTKTLH